MGQASCSCVADVAPESTEVRPQVNNKNPSFAGDIEEVVKTRGNGVSDESDVDMANSRGRGITEASTSASPLSTTASDLSPSPNGTNIDEDFTTIPSDKQASPDGEGSADSIVDKALAEAELLMKDFNVLEAEAVLAKALKEAKECGKGSTKAVEKLNGSAICKQVEELVAQYDPTVDMLLNDHFELLYENDYGKFEIYQPHGGCWFDYRMTVFIDAPVSECVATAQELDLVPKANSSVNETPVCIGAPSADVHTSLTKMPVVIFNVELLFEALRIRDRNSGFCLESIRSQFPANGRSIPAKAWRAVRPWVWVANCWMPRGGGKEGTVLVQVTRVDAGFSIPHFVLSFIFRQLAVSYMKDLRDTAMKAMEEGSPWKSRVDQDKTGLYSKLREVDEIAGRRAEVTGLPNREFFENRPHRLRPTPKDTKPPSHKG